MKMQQRDADSSIESISSDDEDLTALTNKKFGLKAPPTKVVLESHLLNSSEEVSFIREKNSPLASFNMPAVEIVQLNY